MSVSTPNLAGASNGQEGIVISEGNEIDTTSPLVLTSVVSPFASFPASLEPVTTFSSTAEQGHSFDTLTVTSAPFGIVITPRSIQSEYRNSSNSLSASSEAGGSLVVTETGIVGGQSNVSVNSLATAEVSKAESPYIG